VNNNKSDLDEIIDQSEQVLNQNLKENQNKKKQSIDEAFTSHKNSESTKQKESKINEKQPNNKKDGDSKKYYDIIYGVEGCEAVLKSNMRNVKDIYMLNYYRGNHRL
jgi:hypothetical protein